VPVDQRSAADLRASHPRGPTALDYTVSAASPGIGDAERRCHCLQVGACQLRRDIVGRPLERHQHVLHRPFVVHPGYTLARIKSQRGNQMAVKMMMGCDDDVGKLNSESVQVPAGVWNDSGDRWLGSDGLGSDGRLGEVVREIVRRSFCICSMITRNDVAAHRPPGPRKA
jgi:hypothetical protein